MWILRLLAMGRRFGVDITGLPPHLLAFEFLGQFTLEPFLFPRFEEEGMPLYLFDNTFLLHLPLEPAKGAFNGFAGKHPDFSQNLPPLDLQLSDEYACL